MATKVLDIDLADCPDELPGLEPYSSALVLARWGRRVLGQVRLEVEGGSLRGSDIRMAADRSLGDGIVRAIAEQIADSLLPDGEPPGERPSASVVICTRDRPEDLARCLDALCPDSVPHTEIVVVDNAPADDRTRELCLGYPVRYALEGNAGLNWARVRGGLEATGDVIVYIDDDVIPGRMWLGALLAPFRDPEVACVTGLVMPWELETEAQELFERYCGFGRGFLRKDHSASTLSPLAAANVGAGACMAFRRHLVNSLSLFRAEMDCGTSTRSAGDTYAFYRLLSMGYRIVYTPDAVVWHRHRRTFRELRDTLRGYSVGTYSFLLRALTRHGEAGALYTGGRWFLDHHASHLFRGLTGGGGAQPLSLTFAEIRGVLGAPRAYLSSLRTERRKLVAAQECRPDHP